MRAETNSCNDSGALRAGRCLRQRPRGIKAWIRRRFGSTCRYDIAKRQVSDFVPMVSVTESEGFCGGRFMFIVTVIYAGRCNGVDSSELHSRLRTQDGSVYRYLG